MVVGKVKKLFKKVLCAIKVITPYCLRKYLSNVKREVVKNKPKAYYSEQGEDIILKSIFSYQAQGFYDDVGARHPIDSSNTYLFYKKGWCGINIDAFLGSMKMFNRKRPRDINLEIVISDTSERKKYYMFNCPKVNAFYKVSARPSPRQYTLVSTKEMQTFVLKDVLEENLPNG